MVEPLVPPRAPSFTAGPAVPLAAGEGGIPKDSVALCHQVTTLDRSKLTSQLGELSEALLRDVGEALKVAQGLE